jgi:putative oxidoreductase
MRKVQEYAMNAKDASSYWGLTVLRMVAGTIFITHGAEKLFHFGSSGIAGLFAVLHIPLPFISAVAVTLVEFVGGTALVLGAVTRWAAALIAMDMSVAVLMVHRHPALFHKGGIELPLILLASCVALALSGPGAASLDGAIRRKNS